MKYFFLILLFQLLSNNFAEAQTTEDQIRNQAEMLQKMAPGKEHFSLVEFAGKWRLLVELHQQGAIDNYANGESTVSILMEGRYFEFDSHIAMTGFILRNHFIIGYDRINEEYEFYQIDNLSTYPLIAQGQYFPEEKKYEFKGKSHSAIDKNVILPFRIIIEKESDRKFKYELLVTEDGEEVPRLTMTFIRIGEAPEK